MDNLLPPSLTHLRIGGGFNQTINHLPLSLTHLSLHGRFNQSLDSLPSSLTHLCFEDCDFNHSIDCLPSTLVYLSLNTKFNQPITKLPSSLKILQLGRFYNGERLLLADPPSSLTKIFVSTNRYKIPHNYLHIDHDNIKWGEGIIPFVSRYKWSPW